MERLKISRQEIERCKAGRIIITRNNLFRPVVLQNISDGQQIFRPNLDVIVKGHPGFEYQLKYKNDSFSAIAGEEGQFQFKDIHLGDGRNVFDIINPAKRNVDNQNIQFAISFESSRLIYMRRTDPVTGKTFTQDDDISSIVRCQNCHTFFYRTTIDDCGKRCTNCTHNQFYTHKDDDFFREIRV